MSREVTLAAFFCAYGANLHFAHFETEIVMNCFKKSELVHGMAKASHFSTFLG
jgi:hypothetical protein